MLLATGLKGPSPHRLSESVQVRTSNNYSKARRKKNLSMLAMRRDNCVTMTAFLQRRPTMRCLIAFLSIVAYATDLAAQAQPKKILLSNPDQALLKELQSVNPQ